MKNDIRITYPEAILNLRAKLNLSQKDFVKMMKVSYVSVNRWENGHFEPTKLPKVKLKEIFKKEKII